MTRREYIDWHIDYYGVKPRESLLDKYYPKDQIVTMKMQCQVCDTETDHDMLEDGKATVTVCKVCGNMELKECEV